MPKTFNYIGSKLKLLDFIKDNVQKYTGKKCSELDSFGDYFSGTGVVGRHFADNGCKKVISNDIQHYGYIVSSVLTTKDMDIDKVKLEVSNINTMLNSINDTTSANSSHFVYNTYTEGCNDVKRMYLTTLNGLKVDVARQYIDKLLKEGNIVEKEWRCLLKIILYAVTKVSNVASVYGAYLKAYKKCATNNFVLDSDVIDDLIQNDDIEHSAYNTDISSLVNELQETVEVVYLDPPYNNRRYDQNFHVLETVSKYDYPEVKGKTGQRVNENVGAKSFCSKANTKDSFKQIFNDINAKYLFMSYNSEGILSKDEVLNLLNECWENVDCIEVNYTRFKSNTNSNESQQKIIQEYLFQARRKVEYQ